MKLIYCQNLRSQLLLSSELHRFEVLYFFLVQKKYKRVRTWYCPLRWVGGGAYLHNFLRNDRVRL